MSTDLKTIEQDSRSREVFLTSFFGGADRGRCVQLTQIQPNEAHLAHFVQLTQGQSIDLVMTLIDWIKENPTACSVLAERLAEEK
jgi:hypothetical protein